MKSWFNANCVWVALMLFAVSANSSEASQREQADQFAKGFQHICFDTDWISENESASLRVLGFERVAPDSVRRWYDWGNLYRASFIAAADNEVGKPACYFESRAVSASLVRQSLKEWEPAGDPIADEIQNSNRMTMWDVKFRRHSGTVLLNEETTHDSTLVTLVLIGEDE
jgi:hypothetical protein